jgi:hypothetical protein
MPHLKNNGYLVVGHFIRGFQIIFLVRHQQQDGLVETLRMTLDQIVVFHPTELRTYLNTLTYNELSPIIRVSHYLRRVLFDWFDDSKLYGYYKHLYKD